MDVKTTFQSQPAFVFKCINTGKLIYVADKWLYKDKLKYIWKSKLCMGGNKWDSNKIPYILTRRHLKKIIFASNYYE